MPHSFSPKTLSFLRTLKRNNERAWFHAHRDEYDTHVRGPMVAIVEALASDLKGFAPELVADPKVSLFRPFRDTRFSGDKAPIKTNIAAMFPNRTLGRMSGAALYFEVTPEHVWIGGGMHSPDSAQLHAVREHIAKHHRRLDAIVKSAAFKKLGGLSGETISRVPRGFPKEHAAADYLRHKQFLGFRKEPAALATSPGFYKELVKTLKTLGPLVTFLNEPLIGRATGKPHV